MVGAHIHVCVFVSLLFNSLLPPLHVSYIKAGPSVNYYLPRAQTVPDTNGAP